MIVDPPEYLDAELVPIWREVVEHLPPTRKINPVHLEAYCAQISTLRKACLDVNLVGVTHEDATGKTVANPAVNVIRDMHTALSKWGHEFAPASTIRRRRGTMYDATRASVRAAAHLQDKPEFSGAIEAACTLAWLIDEAQRVGIDELQKAAFGTIPTYLKACAALGITPASVPGGAAAGARRGSKLGKLQSITGGVTGAAGA